MIAIAIAAGALTVSPAQIASAEPPSQDPFYSYDPATLSDIAPGTVLRSRTVDAHLSDAPATGQALQLLYRTTTALGAPAVDVTTVLQPTAPAATPRLVSYQSAYDSNSSNCEPSTFIANGMSPNPLEKSSFSNERTFIATLLAQGYTVVTSDFEGEQPDFGAGTQYGRGVLDGIRAALAAPQAGLPADTPIALAGYSGGGIATEWASELAPGYAPEVNAHLVGATMGGLAVNFARNLEYVQGSRMWAAVIPLVLNGVSRAMNIDLGPYLSDYGRLVLNATSNICPAQAAVSGGPYVTWAELFKPEYPGPQSIPVLAQALDRLTMSTGGTPTIPLYIAQGGSGEHMGTPTNPALGVGDGVMLAADTAGLAQEYCARGVTVDYQQFLNADHSATARQYWGPSVPDWVADRFNGVPASSDCGSLPAGVPPGQNPAP